MQKGDYKKSILTYLKGRMIVFICLVTMSSIFLLLAILMDYDRSTIAYAFLLSGVSIGVILAIDFSFYYRKYVTLKKLQHQIHISIEQLPIPRDGLDQEYQALIQALFTTMQEFIYTQDKQYQELLEYYTMWAHQIKTPIAAMHLLLQVDNHSNHDLMLELSRIEQYVEMVLHFLRLKTMSNDLLLRKYALNDIVHEAIKKQSSFFIRKNIHLQLDPIDIEVLTDQKWLSFVIEQVLSNALKYTPHNGSIHIYEKNEILYINDTGTGILPEDLPRVFEKGFTGFNGRMNKTSTGIGLYLCKQIIQHLSHSITIDSTYQQGTCVCINLQTKDMVHE